MEFFEVLKESHCQHADLSGGEKQSLLCQDALNLWALAVVEIPLQANPDLDVVTVDRPGFNSPSELFRA
jgi:hypothetical protein